MGAERRRARRFPVLSDVQQKATLRVGDVLIDVRLVDQSATGFGIRVDEHPGVYPGEVAWLQTISGWTEVRVVKARHDVEGMLIGLERLVDVASSPEPASGRRLPEQLDWDGPKNSLWPVAALGLGLVLLLGFLAWTAVDRYVPHELKSMIPLLKDEPLDPRPAAVRAVEHEAARRDVELKNSIKQAGATMLTLPEVVAHLQLTSKQQLQLQRIVQAAVAEEEALRKSAAANGEREDLAKIERLRQAASDQAMELLNDAQRAEWQTMFDAAMQRLNASDVSSEPTR